MVKQGRRAFWYEEVKGLPLQNPIRLKKENTLEECILAMQESGLGCVLIVGKTENDLAGIFTDKDIVEHFVASSLPKTTSVGSLLPKKKIFTITTATTVVEAVEAFHEKDIRHIPVFGEDGTVQGVLSVRVLVDFIAEHMPEHVLNRPPDGESISASVDGG